MSIPSSVDLAHRSYDRGVVVETRLATVLGTCWHGSFRRLFETAASPDAGARDLWQDRSMARTVLIVDDHEAFRESASALLEAEGFRVVGQAADAEAAVSESQRLRPEVVLLDIRLPGLDGFAVAERLSALPDAPLVVLISSRDAAAYGPRLEAAPARGFIAKRELSGEALAALVG
jgi:CheY-like chemotaxis protein